MHLVHLAICGLNRYAKSMVVNPDQLIVFAVVAQTGSLSQAAKRLYKSQPAVSAQLRQLREAVGEPLYERHRYGISLTPVGLGLLPYAQAVLRAVEAARQYAQELKEGTKGQLRIAASTTTAMYLLPRLLKRFADQNEGLELRLLTCNTQEAVALLESGAADVAMIEGPAQVADWQVAVLAHDDIVVIVPAGHPLARQSLIQVSDLHELPMVRRELGSGTRAVVDEALARYAVIPKTVLEAQGVDAIKEAVLEGFGAGFISRLAVERECRLGLLAAIPIAEHGFTRPLSLVYARPHFCSPLSQRFVQFVTQEL